MKNENEVIVWLNGEAQVKIGRIMTDGPAKKQGQFSAAILVQNYFPV